jgi:hypothetical protein
MGRGNSARAKRPEHNRRNLTEISCLSDLQECSSRKMPMESMKSAARQLPRRENSPLEFMSADIDRRSIIVRIARQ